MAIEAFDQPSNRAAQLRRGSYPIPLHCVSTAGFLGRTERGPLNEPVCIESLPEYCRYFGGHTVNSAVSHAVHDYFLHGGRRAVVVRVANGASRARLDLPTDAESLRLQARYPGRHEILRASVDYERVEDDELRFNLVVQRIGSHNGLVEDQELYPLVSVSRSDTRFIGDVLADSRLIAMAGAPPGTRPLATPPKRPGESVRYVELSAQGGDGDELTDYDVIGSDRDGTGLFAFLRGQRPDLIAIPLPPDQELGTTAFVAASRFAEQRRALFIWDPPSAWGSVDAALLGSRQLGYAGHSIVSYFPRVRPRGTRTRNESGIAASGAIAGMLSHRAERGLWGRDEDMDYALRAARAPLLEVTGTEAQRLARAGINTFVRASGGSIRFVGRVTLGGRGFGPGISLDGARLGNFILNSIEAAAIEASGETDTNFALQRLEGQLRRFFDDLYLHRALAGRTPAQAYYLRTRTGAAGQIPSLRFGFALAGPGTFVDYLVELDGEKPGVVQRLRALEAGQLFS